MNSRQRADFAAVIRHRVMGVAFLVLLALFAGLTYAIFSKTFVSYDEVSLETSKIGLQLPTRADVKIRGVIVGEVLEMESDGDQAKLTLGLYPDQREIVPKNATARILPKTLFGEKFVSLQVPESPSEQSIEAGDTIEQAEVSIEVERVLSDLYPLLRTVQPAQLNYTLTAMADALEGRGDRIGENLVILDDYLQRMNPKIPLLVDDLGKLSQVSDVYADVVPEVATLLRNSVKTGNTFLEKERQVTALFQDVAGFSRTSRDFLERNGDNIIRLSEQGQRQLPVFAKYSDEYPCLLKGIVRAIDRQAEAFRGFTLNINLEVLPRQPRGYNTGDKPVYGERGQNKAPLRECSNAINGVYNQNNLPPQSLVPNIDDGVNYPVGKQRAAPRLGDSRRAGAPSYDVTSGFAGTRAERGLVASIAAPAMQVPDDQVPDVATLLFGPLARGAEVSLR